MHASDDRKDEELEFEYKKVDKRVKLDEADAEPTPQQAESEDAASEAETSEAPAEEEPSDEQSESATEEPQETAVDEPPVMHLSTYQVLRLFVGMLAEQAWINLGIQLAPGKEETEVKLSEAKIAIDTLQFVRKQLESDLADSEKREIDSLLSSLQINYVQRS